MLTARLFNVISRRSSGTRWSIQNRNQTCTSFFHHNIPQFVKDSYSLCTQCRIQGVGASPTPRLSSSLHLLPESHHAGALRPTPLYVYLLNVDMTVVYSVLIYNLGPHSYISYNTAITGKIRSYIQITPPPHMY